MVILHSGQSLNLVPGKKNKLLTLVDRIQLRQQRRRPQTNQDLGKKPSRKKLFSFNKVSKISVAVIGWAQIILGFSQCSCSRLPWSLKFTLEAVLGSWAALLQSKVDTTSEPLHKTLNSGLNWFQLVQFINIVKMRLWFGHFWTAFLTS